MKAATFLVALRRRARTISPAHDPLAEAKRFLDANEGTSEGRALYKVIETLITGTGEFDESEVWSYCNATLELVAALIEDRPEGRDSDEEWRDVTARRLCRQYRRSEGTIRQVLCLTAPSHG
jgi:hypothetical protein